jgi:hypothetical protein
MTTSAERLDDFSTRRVELEAAVLPLATSVDGRRFGLQASSHPALVPFGARVSAETGAHVTAACAAAR